MSAPNFKENSFPLYCIDDSDMDWFFYDDVQEDIDELNKELRFFKISVESGYYCGAQLWVDVTREADNAGFSDGDYDTENWYCRYWLDMCRSEAIRKWGVERRKVLRMLEKLADCWGFEEYVCTARFSNSEAWYEKASNKMARLKAAAIA